MTRKLGLAHLTVIDQPPPQMIRLAARTGFDFVGLRLIAVTETSPGYRLMDDPVMLRETITAQRDTGIAVNDIEFVKITPETDVASLEPFLAAGAALDARHVITAPYDPELTRLADRLAVIAELAKPYSITPILEFFPWTIVPDLKTASAIVSATGNPDIGILVDMLHFDRSQSALADIDASPSARFPFLHLCDAPVHPPYSADDLLHAGRSERLAPGDGSIDVGTILQHLPPDCPASLEVPMDSLRLQAGAEAAARLVFAKAKALLETIG